uniref:procollagen-lysine 5-dioxygenase n=1 Tax=Plectus sambesii TaxID=2011161 RepID=A0A914W011_9BILA
MKPCNLLVLVTIASSLALVACELAKPTDGEKAEDLLIFTVGTDETDGLKRLKRSAEQFNVKLIVAGLGEKWNGGDTRYEAGGGQKIRILRDALEPYKDRSGLLVMFVDAYDVILNADAKEMIERFHENFVNNRVVFSSEGFCWPDKTLAAKYPLVKFGKRYLNSGLFMGYAPEIYKILTVRKIQDNDDDQLYYTQIYLDDKMRTDLKMTLDSMARIFQNLNGAEEDVEVEFDDSGKALAHNVAYNTHPVVIHGNGASKRYLDYLGNYLGNNWNSKTGCVACNEHKLNVDALSNGGQLPLVTLAIFISRPIPFLTEFFAHIARLDYPADRLHLYLHNNETHAEKEVNEFIAASAYESTNFVQRSSEITDRQAKEGAIDYCIAQNCDYLFYVDGDAHLSNANVLKLLISLNRPFVAPMLSIPAKLFSNFWGALSPTGYYARSDDYVQIVQGERVGQWNSPFVGSAYLISKENLAQFRGAYMYNTLFDADMSLCQFARDNGLFMLVDNQNYYGYLVAADDFGDEVQRGRLYPEMWEIFENRQLWEARYLHPEYKQVLVEGVEIEQPCPDVYDFPLMSERFCAEMIGEMEHFGKWSNGKNNDERLAGGYENVPTRDIHMNQIGFERQWLYMLDEFVRPVQEKIFVGYFHSPVEANMMFVVRYKPEEQASLRPHHDASTYSIDVSLNRKDIDYEGGGVRFIRYNCTIPCDKIGWSMIFPGRLTHMHEGLPTTRGTRYIAVSFLNP